MKEKNSEKAIMPVVSSQALLAAYSKIYWLKILNMHMVIFYTQLICTCTHTYIYTQCWCGSHWYIYRH